MIDRRSHEDQAQEFVREVRVRLMECVAGMDPERAVKVFDANAPLVQRLIRLLDDARCLGELAGRSEVYSDLQCWLEDRRPK